MNISMSWLREWVSPDVDDSALVEQLTMAGLELVSLTKVAPFFEKVVIGEVVKCCRHPNADKLNLCQVDIGSGTNLQIICGALNVRVGLKVAVATIGAKLPSGVKIKKVKLRAVVSCGMICSESELGLITEQPSGIMELDSEAPIGSNIREYLNLDDSIIGLDITPNRGDCFSILGIAREVSTYYNIVLNIPKYKVRAEIKDVVETNISNKEHCPKYLSRVIKMVNNFAKTPQWITQKLLACGQHTISAIVDITNFVALELGQPLHAFDLTKIDGDINVRMAYDGESIELLNNQVVSLNSKTLVIADSKKSLAIAGVMGGLLSSVHNETSDILLEAAFFSPNHLIGKARQYGFHTEASMRFERGVDFNITSLALERATQLILEICGGKASVINETVYKSELPKLSPIVLHKSNIKRILGFELDASWIEEKFVSLDFLITDKTENSITIIPPSFRFDISIYQDLIEELVRLYGYDKTPVQKFSVDATIKNAKDKNFYKYDMVNSLVCHGYQEVITYSFISSQYHNFISANNPQVVLSNPISSDMSIMRSSLWAGLLQVMQTNQRRGYVNARFFELGLCFSGVDISEQIVKIAGIVSGNRFGKQWATSTKKLDFFDIKADVEVLLLLSGKNYTFVAGEHKALQVGQTAKILQNNKQIGWVGSLDSRIQKTLSLEKCYLFELDFKSLKNTNTIKYQEFSRYPQSKRDIAIIVDKNIISGEVVASIKNLKQQNLINVLLFDIYEGENIANNKKSIALSLHYQSFEKTLTITEVNAKVAKVVEFIETKYKAVHRVA